MDLNDKIIVVERTQKPIWNSDKLKTAWNKGARAFFLNSMGFDHFPVGKARRMGFIVEYLSDYCSEELALHGFKMLDRLLIKTEYDDPIYSDVCLVIGSEGNVGKQVVEKAEFKGMRVLKHDISLGHTDKDFVNALQKAKVIFICVPLNSKTKFLFDERIFYLARNKAPFIINVSGRHGLVSPQNLLRAVNNDWIHGYACDDNPRDFRMLSKWNFHFTPHVGWRSNASIIKRKELTEKALDKINTTLSFK